MSLVLDTGTMKYRENPNQPWRPLVIKAGMNWESMADTYDPDNGTYEVGQYVLEEGMMYRCVSEITTPETWTPAHWTSVNVGDELSSFIIISDDQPTDETNKIWIAETTTPFGVQIPTMDDHNVLGNTLTQLDEDKAEKADLTNINQTSPTCTVTNGITKGTYFYLDGVLTRAIETISENASFTGSNCETVTAGGLNALNNKITFLALKRRTITGTTDANGNFATDISLVTNAVVCVSCINSPDIIVSVYSVRSVNVVNWFFTCKTWQGNIVSNTSLTFDVWYTDANDSNVY